MPESFDLSHRETQGAAWPGPLDQAGALDKVGLRALPASSLSVASGFAFLFTFVFLQRDREMRSLFVLPRLAGLSLAIVSAALAWAIVILCSRRPGRLLVRLWALSLAVLTSAFLILLYAFPIETWVNALTLAGFAAALVLAVRLYPLRPDSWLLSRIAPLALVAVLVPVLIAVGWTGSAIAASKRLRVDRMIDQLGRWEADVRSVTGGGWSGADWSDSSRAVDRLGQIRLAGQLDLSLWREAFTLGRDEELAVAAGKLLETTVAGLAPDRVPRVSQLDQPAAHTVKGSNVWEESPDFVKASDTVGRYFYEAGRIVSELDVDQSFPESQGLATFKQLYLVKRASLAEELRAQLGSWTDHWAVFRVPACDRLVGQSNMPLGKLVQMPLPIRAYPAANLPSLLRLSLGEARNLGRSGNFEGCRPLGPYNEVHEKVQHEYYRIDCYSYFPRKKDSGADLRLELRLMYDSIAAGGLVESDLPEAVYFYLPVPEGEEKEAFRKQVMSDLSAAVSQTTKLTTAPDNRNNVKHDRFDVLEEGRKAIAVDPSFSPWLPGRQILTVRTTRKK